MYLVLSKVDRASTDIEHAAINLHPLGDINLVVEKFRVLPLQIRDVLNPNILK